jgi:hypothetical protein
MTTQQQQMQQQPAQKQQPLRQVLLQQRMLRLQLALVAQLARLLLQLQSSQASRQMQRLCRSSTQVNSSVHTLKCYNTCF